MGVIRAQALASENTQDVSQDRPAAHQEVALAAPASAPMRKTSSIRAGVQGGKLISKPTPAYPSAAMQASASGVVTIEARIGKDGHVVETSVLRGPYSLRRIAEDAVKHWQYEPTLLNGQPVERVAEVDFTFVLGRD